MIRVLWDDLLAAEKMNDDDWLGMAYYDDIKGVRKLVKAQREAVCPVAIEMSGGWWIKVPPALKEHTYHKYQRCTAKVADGDTYCKAHTPKELKAKG